jgi:hypothetical protein
MSSTHDSQSLELALEGHLGWALLLSGVTGGAGGAAMLLVATETVRRWHLSTDVVRVIGAAGRAPALGLDSFHGGYAIAIVVGGLVGMMMGALMRYSLRVVARILTGILLAPVVWILIHAFVFKAMAPSTLGALPFGPMIAGAIAYGICVALIPPPRRKIVVSDED